VKGRVAFLAVLCVLYIGMIFPLTDYLIKRPFVERLGYVPRPEVMRLVSADQKQLVGESLIMSVVMYFGGAVNQVAANKINVPLNFQGMKNSIEVAIKVDPYNLDSYYFTQAIMVWDMKQVREANELLEFGMKYRDWDWYLPFFLGFNYSFILKDYATAAKYYERVGVLTGNELSINLAGRYLYEAGETSQAIAYLSAMVQTATNDAIKKSLQTRLSAFKAVKQIEQARDSYVKKFKKKPASVAQLMSAHFLASLPRDPYGGSFYIDEKGRVRSTSKFAYLKSQ
jgi:tetratricopeptide (TPR) repeat protein